MNKAQMKYSQAQDIARKSIGIAIVDNRDKIIALLKKYGVAVDNSYSNDELIVGTLAAVQCKPRFRDDLKNLLTETTSKSLSFTGESGMEFFNADGDNPTDPYAAWKAAYATNNPGQAITSGPVANLDSPTTKQKTALGSLLSDKDTLKNILGTGLNVLSTSLTNKSNQKLADKALAIETEKTKQAALAYGQGGNPAGTKKGLSTGAIIGIVGGSIVVIAVAAWLISRSAANAKAKPAK